MLADMPVCLRKVIKLSSPHLQCRRKLLACKVSAALSHNKQHSAGCGACGYTWSRDATLSKDKRIWEDLLGRAI